MLAAGNSLTVTHVAVPMYGVIEDVDSSTAKASSALSNRIETRRPHLVLILVWPAIFPCLGLLIRPTPPADYRDFSCYLITVNREVLGAVILQEVLHWV